MASVGTHTQAHSGEQSCRYSSLHPSGLLWSEVVPPGPTGHTWKQGKARRTWRCSCYLPEKCFSRNGEGRRKTGSESRVRSVSHEPLLPQFTP